MTTSFIAAAPVRALLRIAWPVALARLGIMSMGVVDTIMVGQMAPGELAWQALGWAPTGVFLVAGIGLLAGVQVLSARMVGEGREAAAGAVWRRGTVLGVLAGLMTVALIWGGGAQLLTVFGVDRSLADPAADVMRVLALSAPLHLVYVASAFYLEAIKRPVASTVVMWSANVLNIGLNALLIPHFGAEGSAWATVGARFFLAATLVGWILVMPEARRYGARGAGPQPNAPGYKALLAVGIAAAVSQAVEAGAFSAMTVIAGRIGADAVAAYSILLNQLAVVFMIALGLASATAVLVSEAVGRGDATAARRAAWTGLALTGVAMALCGVGALIFAEPVARAFTADRGLAALVAAQMVWAAAILVPDGGQVVAASGLRARGDNWFPTGSHIIAYACIMPPLAFVLAEVQGAGVAGLMAAIFWASVVSIVILTARQLVVDRQPLPAPAVS